MNVSMTLGVCLLSLTATLSAAAPAATSDKGDKDPNRVICEKQEIIGTRLGSKRVCHTAAEWDAIRQEARQNLDKAQTQRSNPSGN